MVLFSLKEDRAVSFGLSGPAGPGEGSGTHEKYLKMSLLSPGSERQKHKEIWTKETREQRDSSRNT